MSPSQSVHPSGEWGVIESHTPWAAIPGTAIRRRRPPHTLSRKFLRGVKALAAPASISLSLGEKLTIFSTNKKRLTGSGAGVQRQMTPPNMPHDPVLCLRCYPSSLASCHLPQPLHSHFCSPSFRIDSRHTEEIPGRRTLRLGEGSVHL